MLGFGIILVFVTQAWSAVVVSGLIPSNMFNPSSNFLTDLYDAVLLLWIIFAICVLFLTVLTVPCSLVVTCWERTDLLALLYVMFSCVFVTFPYGVLHQVWYLIVWVLDLCLLHFFGNRHAY